MPRSKRSEDRIAVRLLQACDLCFARIYHRLNVLAPCRLPRTGPAILVSNHISGLDPLLIQAACPRLLVWMMAKEYYEIKAMHWIFRTIGLIPVARSGRDMAATRAAMRTLEAGGIVGIFPEGRIETSRDLLPFEVGVALMAMKTGVPVYPTYIDGTQRGKEMLRACLLPQTADVTFGPAVEFDRADTTRAGLTAATDAIRLAVEALRDRKVRHFL